MNISLTTVTLGAGHDLALTRASVLSQTLAPDRHIVVSAVPVECPGAEVHVRPARGVYDALNYGLARSTGDVVGFLHAGDTFADPRVLADVAREFEADPALDYLWADIRYVSGPARKPGRTLDGGALERGLLLRGIYPPHPTLYMRRAAFESVGPYSTAYRICGDFDYWIRLLRRSDLHGRHLPRLTVEMTTGGLSTTLAARLWHNNREKLRVLRAQGLKASSILLAYKYIHVLRNGKRH